MAKSNIEVRILGDNKDLARAISDSESKLGKFAKGAVVAAGGLFAGGALVNAGQEVLSLGGELEALRTKSKTVFEDSLGDVQKWAKGLAPDLGLTEEKLVGMTAGFADLLKPMGFTAAQAAEMSSNTVELSGALSAWTGGTKSAAEVTEILGKAMLGERDGLKALGISIQEADVQQRLMEKGQDKLTGAALQQAKALATQELIMEKSTDAQKAWADGSQEALKEQNRSKASMEQLKETLIKGIYPALQGLLPHLTKAVEWLGTWLPDAIAKTREGIRVVVDWVKANWPAIQATIKQTVDWLQTNVVPVVQQIAEFLVAAFEQIKGWVDKNWPEIKRTIESTVKAIQQIIEVVVAVVSELWSRFGEDILRFTQRSFEAMKQTIDGVLQVIRGIIQTVTSLIRGDWTGAWNGIKDILAGVWKVIQGVIDQALATIKLMLSAAWTVIKEAAGRAWDAIKSAISRVLDLLVDLHVKLPARFVSALVGLAGKLGSALVAPFDDAKAGVKKAIDGAVQFVRDLPGRVLSVSSRIASAGRHIGGALIDGVIGAITGAASVAGNIASAVSSAVSSAAKKAANAVINQINNALEFKISGPGWLPDININPPDIPTFHSGGWVGRPGGVPRDVPAVLQTGEYVMSRDEVRSAGRRSSGPITLVIEGRPFQAMLAEHDERLLYDLVQGVRP